LVKDLEYLYLAISRFSFEFMAERSAVMGLLWREIIMDQVMNFMFVFFFVFFFFFFWFFL